MVSKADPSSSDPGSSPSVLSPAPILSRSLLFLEHSSFTKAAVIQNTPMHDVCLLKIQTQTPGHSKSWSNCNPLSKLPSTFQRLVIHWKSKSTAALFTIARTWNQPKCPPVEEWIKKMRCIYATEYYSAIKRKETRSLVEAWVDLETDIQSEVSQKEKR